MDKGRCQLAALAGTFLWLLSGAASVAAAGDLRDSDPSPGALAGSERGSPAGEATPIREFTDGQGRACRLYARKVIVDGGSTVAYATVCREPNGRWVLSR